jgi:hypothetical protein
MSLYIEKEIHAAASQFATQTQGQIAKLEDELLEMEKHKAAKQAELQTARLAHKRLLNFKPKIGRDYQCSRCWIDREASGIMIAMPGSKGPKGRDFLRCSDCGWTIDLPAH